MTASSPFDGPPYEYSPISSRKKLEWPSGKKVALYIALNLEHYEIDKPEKSISPQTAGAVPDPLNYGWRDYGARVGVWRLLDLFDELGVEPTIMINSDVCTTTPDVVQAGLDREWTCWVAHGKTNSIPHIDLSEDEERSTLESMTAVLESATSTRPRGWLGPALTETFRTPSLLRELGFDYVLDWCCDDQPFPLTVPGMIGIPYDVETNDITSFLARGLQGPQYEQLLLDQLEQLLLDGESSGRMMCIALHSFISGQPFRFKYVRRALQQIVSHKDVWVTTTDAIADHYRSVTPHDVAAG
jgi:peptidoglycan/xylan/chitin deacetylase (PgdA/CDA1 family)